MYFEYCWWIYALGKKLYFGLLARKQCTHSRTISLVTQSVPKGLILYINYDLIKRKIKERSNGEVKIDSKGNSILI